MILKMTQYIAHTHNNLGFDINLTHIWEEGGFD